MFWSRSVTPHADNGETSVGRVNGLVVPKAVEAWARALLNALSASPGGTCTESMAAIANWVGVGKILVDGLCRRGVIAGEQPIAVGGDEGVQIAAAAPAAMVTIITTRVLLVTRPIDSRDGIECTSDGPVISMTTNAAAFPVWITHMAETCRRTSDMHAGLATPAGIRAEYVTQGMKAIATGPGQFVAEARPTVEASSIWVPRGRAAACAPSVRRGCSFPRAC